MLRGLTRAGLNMVGDDKQLLEQASKNGFQAVELDAASLIEAEGLEAAKELLRTHKMTMGAIDLGLDWRNGEEEFQEGLASLERRAKAAALLGGDVCCTYILPSTDNSPAVLAVRAVGRLRQCADIVGAHGLKLALEFVGPHHWRSAFRYPFIHTLEDTLAFIDAIDRNNVGLLLDSYHWHTNGLTTADLERLSSNQIAYVHLNDAKEMPIEEVLDHDRLYPGEGVIDLGGFMRSLQKIDYTGIVAQEVLMPQDDRAPQSSEEAFLRSKTGFDQVFAQLH
ncbi:sugar phosphate isomerase/epimerase [Paenibacillus sp. JCM 10914]|uniref:sugar phosphate isomerase/epimerase family protein n=1 Tax=Paenibacillus sp. JCM 10914 TaxID=1236974 RepID=UPI0003CC9490|nr:sugar phosphate isomerase/epimerase family protein [Paenibacillus sp. JCM 10914]GAE05678.1 xylose isomerase domain protein TIM barrel [Paenibacillus sp. JCM 10914]